MSRELPETKLTKSYEPMVPGSTEWMVNFQDERTLAPLGFVYCPPNPIGVRRPQNPWCAQASVVGGAQEVGWHPTRKAAVIAVEKAYQRFQDELEAHNIAMVLNRSAVHAREDALRQRHKNGNDAALVVDSGGFAARMDGPIEALRELRNAAASGVRDQLRGTTPLELELLAHLATTMHMIDLEIDRRDELAYAELVAQEISRKKSHQLWTVQDQFKHALTKSDQLVMGSHRLNLLKVGDSPLVRELHEHLVSPWHLTTPVMDALLDRVRNLEARVAESGRE